jgi:3-dehydroquinate dehydratase II
MAKIGVIHGPNLNLLGSREPEIYGSLSLDEINDRIADAVGGDHKTKSFQSNSEGAIIDRLHEWASWADGIVINAGAYTHSSYAIRDALTSIAPPAVEVHLSNIHVREEFRHTSVIAPACIGQICGFGWYSYVLGVQALVQLLTR